MRRIGIALFAISVVGPWGVGTAVAGKTKPPAKPTVVAAAPSESKPAAKPAKPGEGATADAKPAEPAAADAKPATPEAKPAAKPKSESMDDLLEQAGKAGATQAKEDEAAKAAEAKAAAEAKKKEDAKRLEDAKKQAAKVAPKPAGPAVRTADAPLPTGSDDNDKDEEAAAPTKLEAVKQTGGQRHRGNYELGNLDCRTLDGAGIERKLPPRIVSGEEPDIMCRVIVTQPGDVASEEHSLTLSVLVGGKETWRQQRKVRMSAIGRRAMVFVIPMDKISSDDPAMVTLSAVLSQPAAPAGGRTVKFNVESLD